MSIGPRLPKETAENCGCGGILVFSNVTNDGRGVWECGLCQRRELGPPVQTGTTYMTREDIMETDTIITNRDPGDESEE